MRAADVRDTHDPATEARGSNVAIPGDLVARFLERAELLSRSGPPVGWTRVAFAALRRGMSLPATGPTPAPSPSAVKARSLRIPPDVLALLEARAAALTAQRGGVDVGWSECAIDAARRGWAAMAAPESRAPSSASEGAAA